jgi:hypothetical protein
LFNLIKLQYSVIKLQGKQIRQKPCWLWWLLEVFIKSKIARSELKYFWTLSVLLLLVQTGHAKAADKSLTQKS